MLCQLACWQSCSVDWPHIAWSRRAAMLSVWDIERGLKTCHNKDFIKVPSPLGEKKGSSTLLLLPQAWQKALDSAHCDVVFKNLRGPLSLRVSFRQCKVLFLLYDQHQHTSFSRPESALTKSFSDLFLFIFNALRVGLSVYSRFQIQACHYRQYRAINKVVYGCFSQNQCL